MTNEEGAVGGIKIRRGNQSSRRKPAQYQFVHHKSHMTAPGRRGAKPAANSQSIALQAVESIWLSGCFCLKEQDPLDLNTYKVLPVQLLFVFAEKISWKGSTGKTRKQKEG
jgi:hypothetical protein